MQNDAGTVRLDSHKIRTVCSADVPPDGEKESPGALTGATGDELHSWLEWFDHNTKREDAARALMNAVLDCDPGDRLELLERFYDASRPGFPIVSLDSLMAEAGFWADRASPAERKAYALACYTRMAPADQAGFLAYVQKGDA